MRKEKIIFVAAKTINGKNTLPVGPLLKLWATLPQTIFINDSLTERAMLPVANSPDKDGSTCSLSALKVQLFPDVPLILADLLVC